MRALKYTLVFVLSFVLLGMTSMLLASTGLKSQAGYAKLALPGWLERDTLVSVDMGPVGVKPVRWAISTALAAKQDSFELSERVLLDLLDDIDGIQLRIYQVDQNRQIYDQAIDASVAQLKQHDWQTLVSARQDDERVAIMQSQTGELITGLTILVNDGEHAVFINLCGQFNPQELAEQLNQSRIANI